MVLPLGGWTALTLTAVTAWIVKVLVPQLLPYGPAIHIPDDKIPQFLEVDPTNDGLRTKYGKTRKIYERTSKNNSPLLKGPETVMFHPDGTMYVMTEDAKLVSLTDISPHKNDHTDKDSSESDCLYATARVVVNLGVGRPLGGQFTSDGTLYFADTLLGLARVRVPNSTNINDGVEPKVELVVSRVLTRNGGWSRIAYANDVDIGPQTGFVYFTDSTTIPPPRLWTKNSWDTMQGAKWDLIRGSPTGRVLQYDPTTDQTTILAEDIWFANGIAVDGPDEESLVVADTFGSRLRRIDLRREQGTRREMSVVGEGEMTGFPDGVGCSMSHKKCYAAIITKRLPLMAIYSLPSFVSQFLRTILLVLPKSLYPKTKPYGGVVEIVLGGEGGGKVTRIIQDPMGEDVALLTSVTEHEGRLYMGSLANPFVTVYDLN